MAKKESSFFNMVSTLMAVTLLAAGLLGSIYAVTKEPIRLAELKRKNDAIKAVIPEFNNNPPEEFVKIGVDGDSLTLYTARLDSTIVGTAVETFTNNGFSGLFKPAL